MKLTKYERSILNAFKKNEFEIVPTTKKIRATYKAAAEATLRKDKSITIRLNSLDLERLKQLAVQSGEKYQTYIGHILHTHVFRRLKAA